MVYSWWKQSRIRNLFHRQNFIVWCVVNLLSIKAICCLDGEPRTDLKFYGRRAVMANLLHVRIVLVKICIVRYVTGVNFTHDSGRKTGACGKTVFS